MSVVVAAVIAVTLGGLLNGVAGFGFALVAVPILLWALPPTSVAFVAVALVGLTAAGVALRSRTSVDTGIVMWLLAGAVGGLWIGTRMLAGLPAEAIALIANLAVVLFAVLLAIPSRFRLRLSNPVLVAAGLLSGAMTTLIGLPGPPTVLALSAARMSKDATRSTIAAFLAINSVVGLAFLLFGGVVDGSDVILAVALAPPALVGLALGARYARRITQDAYRMLVLGVLVTMGVAGTLTVLFG